MCGSGSESVLVRINLKEEITGPCGTMIASSKIAVAKLRFRVDIREDDPYI